MAGESIWVNEQWQTQELVDFYTLGTYVKQPHPEPNATGVDVFDAMAFPPEPIEGP